MEVVLASKHRIRGARRLVLDFENRPTTLCSTRPSNFSRRLLPGHQGFANRVRESGALLSDDGQPGLRPESCWNDCLTRRKPIRPCVPSHVAYEVGAARQQTVRSPRTMDPHSQEWPRNREATVYLPA